MESARRLGITHPLPSGAHARGCATTADTHAHAHVHVHNFDAYAYRPTGPPIRLDVICLRM